MLAAVQYGLDELNQNKAVNKAGGIVGKFQGDTKAVTRDALQPYDEVSRRLRACLPVLLPVRVRHMKCNSRTRRIRTLRLRPGICTAALP